MVNKTRFYNAFIFIIIFTSFYTSPREILNPQFSDYQVEISKGPFKKNIIFSNTQNKYSMYWKENIQKQLNYPVNFAGHFRIYTAFGGHGIECLRDNWVCGWVIDKHTGKIVASLPQDNNGSNRYADITDNGTPVGLPFEIVTYKDSSMIVITGQVIPLKNNEYDNPICKTVIFDFNGNEYMKIIESRNGCNIE
ncbi:hypothetical protein [Pseudocitrobacter faecalis]|uniref:hypothetical protein n=1 Tax=Pseudocitrobacter faecalis TaxID=1398493 RepID=UPI003B9FD875